MLWRQPLWAVPFALLFGTMFGSWTLASYLRAYAVSLVFAYCIGYSIWAWECLLLPRFGAPSYRGGTLPLWGEALGYALAAVVGGYLAAVINHFFVLPGFLGSVRSMIVAGFFILLFVAMFTGISYAVVFYRQSIDNARAVETARAELAQAELRALRAQIHPHFLFNTLNSIAALIVENPAAAEDTTTRLAEVFRYTLTASRREQVSLAEELAFLRDYLAIERVRFGDRLRVRESIGDGIGHVPVPSLLLQPVVENAVKYGVSERTEGGTVSLSARREGDRLVLEIADDGPGMSEARHPGGTGFGLSSVRERLRAAGLGDALAIESAPGRGTRVRITLPSFGAAAAVAE
jgi:signal transduction histidine kinase